MEKEIILNKIIDIINSFPLKVNQISIKTPLKDTINLFSSLISLRVKTILSDNFGNLDFESINEFSTIEDICNIVIHKNNELKLKDISKNKSDNFLKNSLLKNNFDKFSIGIDIENIDGLPDDIMFFSQSKLRNKIFTPKEVIYSTNRENPKISLLGIFCAKEAILKTLNGRELEYLNKIEILHKEDGKPFTSYAADSGEFELSITHSLNYVVAVCCRIKRL